MNWLAVFIGGGLGSVCRYGVSKVVLSVTTTLFPLGTLMANLLSCVVLAVVIGGFTDKITDTNIRLLILMGFCGGFSTFSTFSLETLELIRAGQHFYAIANIFVSILACIGVIYLLTVSKTGQA